LIFLVDDSSRGLAVFLLECVLGQMKEDTFLSRQRETASADGGGRGGEEGSAQISGGLRRQARAGAGTSAAAAGYARRAEEAPSPFSPDAFRRPGVQPQRERHQGRRRLPAVRRQRRGQQIGEIEKAPKWREMRPLRTLPKRIFCRFSPVSALPLLSRPLPAVLAPSTFSEGATTEARARRGRRNPPLLSLFSKTRSNFVDEFRAHRALVAVALALAALALAL